MQLICSCRQTSEALQRSVHTARTAWALSVAENDGAGGRGVRVGFDVVDEFLVFVSIVDGEFEFTFFGPEDDGLPFHAADHVEGSLGLTAQRHLQQVFLDAGLDGFAQLGGDLEEAIGRAQTFNALMRPLVIVIFDPVTNAFPGRLEAVELSAGKELLPDGLPEPFDLAEGHGMMRAGFEVVGAVLLHLGLETGGAAPVDVLATVVGEHLPGRLKLRGGDAEDFENIFGGMTAEQVSADQEAGVVIHEADEIGVLAAQTERENIRLPHLVGRGPLKEARPGEVTPSLGRALHQTFLLKSLAHRLRAGRKEKDPAQQLRDAFDPARGFLLFKCEDFFPDGLGQFMGRATAGSILETLLALVAITGQPLVQSAGGDVELLGDGAKGKALFEVELHGPQPLLKTARAEFFWRSSPRGGGGVPLLLYRFIVIHADTSLSLKCQPISGHLPSHELVVSTIGNP
jgi:hypothetical protein